MRFFFWRLRDFVAFLEPTRLRAELGQTRIADAPQATRLTVPPASGRVTARRGATRIR